MSEPWIRGSTLSNILSNSTAELSSSSMVTLPQMLEKYSSIYNSNGRIGIYTREERDVIISRFYEKRKKRVWVKKIRYHCRKNLADNRIRVKGRFVRNTADGGNHADEEEEDGEDEDDDGGLSDPLQAMKKKRSHMMTSSDALNALLFVSERRLELEREFRAGDLLPCPCFSWSWSDDNNSSGSGSTSTQSHVPPKRKKNKLRHEAATSNAHEDDDNQASELEEPDSSDSRVESSSSVPTEEMSLIDNVRSRKRMRRHSIAY